MSKAVWIAGLAVVGIAAGAWLLMSNDSSGTTSPASSGPSAGSASEGTGGGDGKAPRRSLLANVPKAKAGATDTKAPAVDPSKLGGVSSVDVDPDATALVGLGLKPMDDGLREKLKIPESSQIGEGVVVDRIHPDSPAAEIFMKKNDVIVRADNKKVNSIEELEKLVGSRDATLLTVSRNGVLVQMVIKKPFRPKK